MGNTDEIQPFESHSDIMKQLYLLVSRIKRRQISDNAVVKETCKFFRIVLSIYKPFSTTKTIDGIKKIAKELMNADPLQLVIGNIIRRILFIIREHCASDIESDGDRLLTGKVSSSANNVSSMDAFASVTMSTSVSNTDNTSVYDEPFSGIWQLVNQDIQELELENEFENVSDSIGDYALEHIHASEVILTYGISNTVIEFLKTAKRKGRSFEVVVAESAPSFNGHITAQKLASEGINTTVITDSALFAMMARVNKVIIGIHAVLANGGLLTHTGGHMLAIAARAHAIPVLVCTGLYKLSPLFPHDQDTFNALNSPASVLGFKEWDETLAKVDVSVVNPAYDYVPPHFVDLLITNNGCIPPTYVYRMLQESYSYMDRVL